MFVDHLFVDQAGTPTLIEAKHSGNSELRRSVVGQMLDYASRAVAHWSADRLADRFRERCQSDGLDQDEEIRRLLRAVDPEPVDAPAFWRSVETKLRAGEVRLIFVAGSIPEELRRIVEFLNHQMEFAEVLAVEIPQFVGADLQTLVPRVYGMTAEARTRKRSAGGASAPADNWTEPEFLSHVGQTHGEQAARAASAIVDGCKGVGGNVSGGAYSLILSWPLVEGASVKRNAEWVWPFYILDSGSVAVVWQFIKPPFDQDAKRKDLLARLNAIPGVTLAPDAIRGRPTFPLTALAAPGNVTRFLEVGSWVRDEVARKV